MPKTILSLLSRSAIMITVCLHTRKRNINCKYIGPTGRPTYSCIRSVIDFPDCFENVNCSEHTSVSVLITFCSTVNDVMVMLMEDWRIVATSHRITYRCLYSCCLEPVEQTA